ncbi:M2 family metallopeptidase [Flagellatimonas centrodinii]|uniref:M2 family metallopeptidase n=1 Tax=Flagellatimonas centrodinii TaxID=2806210 RepID=UPI001FEFFF39|nr:M2 family metallopeptidase [Flagellatimonas centrodinii]ULQ45245.1 M2 family metallopeptidase [Flagellatimonas centrodinii]
MSKFAVALLIILCLPGCRSGDDGATAPATATPAIPTPGEADALVADINRYQYDNAARLSAAFWVAATYINDDSQRLSAAAGEELLRESARNLEAAKRFVGVDGLKADTARALMLLRNVAAPAPSAPALQGELAELMARMEANYGAAKWCPDGDLPCLSLPEIEKVINNVDLDHTPDEIAAAWAGWHETARPIRDDYVRFVELMNTGAREMGAADAGEVWRGGYDMPADAFASEVERLWSEVSPLYEALHCQVRARLSQRYGEAVVPADGLIPAHLLGNMWAQQWANLYPLMTPYPGIGDLDVTTPLVARRDAALAARKADFKGTPTALELADMEQAADRDIAIEMTRIAEDFYASLGFPALPDSFWARSLLVKPRDREVVCHASAWDMNYQGDVRIKQCIEPDEEQLTTIHHELGHVYYYLMYNDLPPLFQTGAHDGFHEAIGDTITLSLTPAHLAKVGLVGSATISDEAVINQQMKLALDKITFLPWGKLVDQWRWDVFAGRTPPAAYNSDWWALRARYQGVAPPLPRAADDFDPGAKYHIPGNTPYTRYFLSFVLQFQFQKALCEAAGHEGPLYDCDIYGNAAAGQRLRAMLALGASQPWQDSLEALTGTRQMSAAPLVEYFTPLLDWLAAQNQGLSCGWPGQAGG